MSFLDRQESKTDDEEVRVYTAALLLVDALRELKSCRQVLEAIAKGLAG